MVSKPCGFRTAPAIQDSCPETRKRHLSSVTRGLPPHGMGRWIARRARRRGRRSKAEPELGADAPPLRADSAHRPTSPSNGEEATPSPPAGRGIKGEGIKGEGRAALAAQGKSLWKALSRCPSSGACAPPSPRSGRRGRACLKPGRYPRHKCRFRRAAIRCAGAGCIWQSGRNGPGSRS